MLTANPRSHHHPEVGHEWVGDDFWLATNAHLPSPKVGNVSTDVIGNIIALQVVGFN